MIKRQERQLKALEQKENDDKLRYHAVLPDEFVLAFEQRFVRKRSASGAMSPKIRSRGSAIWRAAKKMIVFIGLDPTDWLYHNDEIYDYFYFKRFSIRYIQKILRVGNLWGFFICKKIARPFLPISTPKGYEQQRLIDAFYQKTANVRKVSTPLFPDELNKKKHEVNPANFNWLYLSVWLGLRPLEVDSLHNSEMWNLETLGNGRKILRIYQTKIVALPPEDRWKPIPILFDEQVGAITILLYGDFKRPLAKTMRRHFGKEIDLYGGRKGFTDLMLSRGQLLENISIWMGHSTLSRTWRSYKIRRKFHLSTY